MKTLLLTPPFTQINTPYPATAFLTQYLKSKGYDVKQADLGIQILLSLLSSEKLKQLFERQNITDKPLSKSSQQILYLQNHYSNCVDPVIRFLQTKETGLAYRIVNRSFLPEGKRFENLLDMDHFFGSVGLIDQARYLATLFLNDLSDFLSEVLGEDFGFSRYAERIALAATEFNIFIERLNAPNSIFDDILEHELEKTVFNFIPEVVALTVPFPGCLLGALKIGKWFKKTNPKVKIVLGGGYVSTELRDLKNTDIFEFVDFICLDQGEISLKQIINYLSGTVSEKQLKKTYYLNEDSLIFSEGSRIKDAPFSETGFPDYSGLFLDKYLSVIEMPNAMHRLWNDGRWNKMQVATGCYWKKCTFCDTNLDYIKNYSTVDADLLVDRIESVINQTGQTSFHFVDEAAPPARLKALALAILKRGIKISWWTNIRFEKSFSGDLCQILADSGCIAVSGGLETVSDRLLKKMNKGVSIQQAAHSLSNFKKAGILVHAYLMYGFPTQTSQETIDALEIVRQLFLNGLLDSCYWHQFTLTAHSEISKNPEAYNIDILGPKKGMFAWNDLVHQDKSGIDHSHFRSGLTKAVYNFMYGIGLDEDVLSWFDFEVTTPTVSPHFIELTIGNNHEPADQLKRGKKLVWQGSDPVISKSKHKQTNAQLRYFTTSGSKSLKTETGLASWLAKRLKKTNNANILIIDANEFLEDYCQEFNTEEESLINSNIWKWLRRNGLLLA